MYFTTLPDHGTPGFNEQLHFSRFGKSNIIFNASSTGARCDHHVGCLSIKTVLSGEEWYGINGRSLAVRPGQFLILNDGQEYSCRIDGGTVKTVSVFFRREFASAALNDFINDEETLLDNPFRGNESQLEFIQTLRDVDSHVQSQLYALVASLDDEGYEPDRVDEYLIPLLGNLIRVHKQDAVASKKVRGIKSSTKKEIYRRLCVARDVLSSCYRDKTDLKSVSEASCLSVPQLVRQFKSVFGTTPHRYLTQLRLRRAAELLQQTNKSVYEIAWSCGFENASAFSRAFKAQYGIKGSALRKA